MPRLGNNAPHPHTHGLSLSLPRDANQAHTPAQGQCTRVVAGRGAKRKARPRWTHEACLSVWAAPSPRLHACDSKWKKRAVRVSQE